MSHPLELLRAHRANSGGLKRGTISQPTLKSVEFISDVFSAGSCALGGAILGGIGWGIYKQSLEGVVTGALWGAFVLFLIYSLMI